MEESKPYWDNPLQEEFQVSIKKVEEQNGVFFIQINEDVIRPEGGGQAGDHGWLDEIEITNTLSVDDKVKLETKAPLEEGITTKLRIDMEWRRASMRNHTAEHLLVKQLMDLDGNLKLGYIWVNGNQGIVDIEGDVQMEHLFEAEIRVQQIINMDKPVYCSFRESNSISDSVRAREGLEGKHDRLRIVSVEGIDDSACSGIHVRSTGDIGFFKIVDFKHTDTGMRLQFYTHEKAATWVYSIYNEILKRKSVYPYEIEQIGAVIDKARITQENREEMLSLITRLLSQLTDYQKVGDVTFIHHYLPGLEVKDLRDAMKEIPKKPKSCILLFAPGRKANLLFWTNEMPKQASEYISEIIENLGGRGGGRGDSYTGGFAELEEHKPMYETIVDEISCLLKKEI